MGRRRRRGVDASMGARRSRGSPCRSAGVPAAVTQPKQPPAAAAKQRKRPAARVQAGPAWHVLTCHAATGSHLRVPGLHRLWQDLAPVLARGVGALAALPARLLQLPPRLEGLGRLVGLGRFLLEKAEETRGARPRGKGRARDPLPGAGCICGRRARRGEAQSRKAVHARPPTSSARS